MKIFFLNIKFFGFFVISLLETNYWRQHKHYLLLAAFRENFKKKTRDEHEFYQGFLLLAVKKQYKDLRLVLSQMYEVTTVFLSFLFVIVFGLKKDKNVFFHFYFYRS